AAHKSKEKGHQIALDYLNQSPLLDLDMRLGEGTGAALGINLLDLSLKLLTQMATFQEAGVATEKESE
ncbi:MAG: nicotinate-nucleotide--dimethylbenzimidazole phosphoribosyltransferase, partial [Clostridia bacterium]|nr:nicotinate-nucleotide--dimethylbenzimidazole phosphoribosyltransferase [Clostridia bacterium]